MDIYLVGGAVRDDLLGLPVNERDWLVVGATAEQMRAQGYRQVGKDFPVFLHPETREEYALARTERKTGPGYKGFEVHADVAVTLEQDLQRRDLTINAMARDRHGNIIDPYHGREDLQQGLLRHVSGAFAEDPVRILRTARFAAHLARWGFSITHDTNKLMREMVSNGEIDQLVPERVWAELEKALKTDRPSRFFKALHGCGALAKLFPEIDVLYTSDATYSDAIHGDAGKIYAMRALEQTAIISTDPKVRFAALAMNLGSNNEKTVNAVEQICERFRLPNDFRQLSVLAARYHLAIERAAALSAGELLQLIEDCDAIRRSDRFADLLLACEGDCRAQNNIQEYDPGVLLLRALDAINQVDASKLAANGLKGAEIAEELSKLRIKAIQETVL